MPNPWPELTRYSEWSDTADTVHRWSQIVGKIRLGLGAPINHSWGSTLYVTPRGLSTSSMPYEDRSFEIVFDLVDHTLRLRASDGRERWFPLEPMSVARFYSRLMDVLDESGIEVRIYPWPVEIPDPILRLDEDEEHASYDRDAVQRFWRALVQVDRVFTTFRSRFIGKASPVHFFWGAFDLAVTRFSGRAAPRHPGGVPNCPDSVIVEAYSHELSSAGFWPGSAWSGVEKPAFYAYAYPEPGNFSEASIRPDEAYYSTDLHEYLLPYDAVRGSTNPDGALLDFLQSTYEAAADLGGWDRSALEREVG